MSRARVLTPALALVIVAAVVGVFVATSGAGTKAAPASGAAGSAVSVARTSLGPMLVDASGRTLYLFEGDRPNVSTLSAAGQAIWPPFTASATPRGLNGAVAADIGRIAATGQITYNGHPLYYYVGDQKPGQTTGQGLNQFGALWYVLSARGNAIVGAAQSTSSAGAGPAGASSSGASSYGY
jgi:predicted lipoprotein with Yx(FWY)xxD motif